MKDRKNTDNLYSNPQNYIVDFAFDKNVASVFPDMIRRSVPGYETVIPLLGLLAGQYAQPGSHIYDLGCSLGAATLSMRQRITQDNCRIIAVDNAEAMTQQCRENVSKEKGIPVEVLCEDIRNIDIQNASVVTLNFTLQFIDPDRRLDLLKKIHNGMNDHGILILSEKINFTEHDEQLFQQNMHIAFKKANGYSEMEISQKRTALENVLIPDTKEQHQQRLKEAGFSPVHFWFQCFNFISFVAFK
ncbi:MAG: carboxy-S-adenosyl-L-methionine synthase CmoA [Gammaproteobacteria bacterium]|nr:carboxy-S-adenosyl-L-methionine synthase CmoA [Gammaproteobacteria bacterium]